MTRTPSAATTRGIPEPGPRPLSGRLAGMSLPRQVMVLSVWPLLEQYLSFLVGMVDIVLAARLEPEAVGIAATDALGIAGYVMWLMGMLLGAVGIGAAALVSRAVGSGRQRLANAATGQAVLLAVLMGLLITVGLVWFAEPIGALAGLDDEAGALATRYLQIVGFSAVANGLLFMGAACLRAAGDARTPFVVMVVVNVVNIVTSVLFVLGPEPLGGWGVTGIAAGTALAWFVGALITLWVLIGGRSGIALTWFWLRPHWHTTKRIVRVGIPQLLESLGIWAGNFAVLALIGRLAGEGLIGAHMIAVRIESLSFLGGFAVAQAASTLMGQYLGARDPRRAGITTLACTGIAVVIMGVFGVAFIVFPEFLTSIVSNKEAHLAVTPELLWICGWVQPFFAISIVMSSALRGAGDTKVTMWLSFVSLFAIRLPLVVFFGWYMEWGLVGVWYGLTGEWLIRASLFMGRFLQGGWQRVEV
ncbi:MATE family efflux transporter [Mucisphaera calidilacus]|uniref:MATE family efflux transporter n=1 Tax=Mucisphaera calidilacus TaxID=2527982 RepID=UPI0011A2BCC5|nr:MATE family efflux transporter [Mucisphaera calidilacus]